MPEQLHRAGDYANLLHRFADRVAVADLSGTITYAALLRRAAAVGHRLVAAGVRPGDPVASLNRNAIPAVWASIGIHLAGAAEVALNANLAEADRRYCLQLAGVRHVVCAETEAPFFAAHDVTAHTIETTGERPLDPGEFPPVGFADWAKISFTSGTTGLPKGIVTDQRGRWVGNLLQRAAMPGRPGATGRLLLMTPFSHGAALLTYAYLDQGGSVMLLDGVDPGVVLPLIERGEIDEMFAPPTVLAKLVAAADGRELPGLKVIYCGTAVLSPGLYARARAIFGPVIRVTYGKTEVINPICVLEPPEVDEWYAEGGPGADACVGWPATGVEIMIDAGGRQAAPGEVGHAAPGEIGNVLIRAHQMMAGFLRPSGYEKLDPGAFHDSGDLGTVDARGRLHLVGRAADVIKTGGYKVAPEEVERALAGALTTALGGGELAVVGLPSEYWGEVIAVVAERPRAGWQEAVQAAASGMTGYKRPRLFLAMDELPRNAMLKISRKALRERILETHRLVDGPRPVLEPV